MAQPEQTDRQFIIDVTELLGSSRDLGTPTNGYNDECWPPEVDHYVERLLGIIERQGQEYQKARQEIVERDAAPTREAVPAPPTKVGETLEEMKKDLARLAAGCNELDALEAAQSAQLSLMALDATLGAMADHDLMDLDWPA